MNAKKAPNRRKAIDTSAQPPSCVCQAVATPTPTISGEFTNVGTPSYMIHYSTSFPDPGKTLPLPTPMHQLLDRCIEKCSANNANAEGGIAILSSG
jgi:hypothetical protein